MESTFQRYEDRRPTYQVARLDRDNFAEIARFIDAEGFEYSRTGQGRVQLVYKFHKGEPITVLEGEYVFVFENETVEVQVMTEFVLRQGYQRVDVRRR